MSLRAERSEVWQSPVTRLPRLSAIRLRQLADGGGGLARNDKKV